MSYLYYRPAPGLGYLGQPAAPPTLTGPTPIQRGMVGNYEVTNAPRGATFSNWKFVGGGVTLRRGGNNNLANWQGTMVQGGTINVDMKVGTNILTLTLPVTLTARPWTENTPPIPLPRSGQGSLPVQPRLGRPGLDARDPGLGTTDTREVHAAQPKFVIGGPNDGFNYLPAAPVTWTPKVFTNEALYDSSHPFFRAHDPMQRGAPLPGGRLQIGTIQLNVEAHEGIIAPPPQAPPGYASHWQLLLNHLAVPGNQINIPLERDVTHGSRETKEQFSARVQRFLEARVAAAKNASKPHPDGIFKGVMYFNYPYISPRTLRLRVVGAPFRLALTNPAGGTVWASGNPSVATVDRQGIVRPGTPGRTIIRVTNTDGDSDQITVNVDP